MNCTISGGMIVTMKYGTYATRNCAVEPAMALAQNTAEKYGQTRRGDWLVGDMANSLLT
jgi:hypothetical protein